MNARLIKALLSFLAVVSLYCVAVWFLTKWYVVMLYILHALKAPLLYSVITIIVTAVSSFVLGAVGWVALVWSGKGLERAYWSNKSVKGGA